MGKTPYYRRILLVNKSVQMRLIVYGVFVGLVTGFFAVSLMASAARAGLHGQTYLVFGLSGLAVFVLVTLLGLVVSSQIAGPIFRLHRNIKRIANGEPPEPIHIRRGDAYGDLFADYNAMVERLNAKESRTDALSRK